MQQDALRDQCQGVLNDVLDFVLQSKSIKTVILTARNPFFNLDDADKPRWRAASGDTTLLTRFTFMPEYANAMRRTLTLLREANKHVIFLIDIPETDFDPKSCYKARPLELWAKPVQTPCAITRSEFANQEKLYREMIDPILRDFPEVRVFDPTDALCDDKYCWVMKDGQMLYRDNNHFSLAGSRYIARFFGAAMKRGLLPALTEKNQNYRGAYSRSIRKAAAAGTAEGGPIPTAAIARETITAGPRSRLSERVERTI